jgi:hypothetical protein
MGRRLMATNVLWGLTLILGYWLIDTSIREIGKNTRLKLEIRKLELETESKRLDHREKGVEINDG